MARHSAAKIVHWRLFFVLMVFSVVALLVLGRLFSLQILRYREFAEAAVKQRNGTGGILPRRGTIYFQDKDGKLQAAGINRAVYTVFVSIKDLADPEITASELAGILGGDPGALKAKLTQPGNAHRIVARKIEESTAKKIQQLGKKEITLAGESRRTYPAGEAAAHILGFVKFDKDEESGQYGIERWYEEELSGTTGLLEDAERSLSYLSSLGKRIINPSPDGKDIVLTIDFNIQKQVEERLAKLLETWSAESATIAVLDPVTGRILALAASPGFNPNNPGGVKDLKYFLNPAVEANYELGSVLKPITMAAAVNEGVVTPDTEYEDTGFVKIKGYSIKNYDGKANGVQTMTNVLEKSLNTGAVFLERKLGHEQFLAYLKRFGFGEKAGIDLPGEVRGDISNLEAGRDIDFATASFGQGIAVTPLQLMMATAAIANGGNLLKPYVVEKITDQAGTREIGKPAVRQRVISPETSETVSRMLVSVTRNGFDNRAGVKGYFVAGKTGTAQIPNQNGKGYSDEVTHSFVGYAPAFKPRFLIFIQLNKPKGVNFASASLTPAFHDLAAYILSYYNVPPDER